MCCKLFERVYSVFISHFKTKIYPALARILTDLPKPLQEDDLDFTAASTNEGEGVGDKDDEETKNEENSKSFPERLEAWRQA